MIIHKKTFISIFLFTLLLCFNGCKLNVSTIDVAPEFKLPVNDVKKVVHKIIPYKSAQIHYRTITHDGDTILKSLVIKLDLFNNISFSEKDFYEAKGKEIAKVVKHALKYDSLYKRYAVVYSFSNGESGHAYDSDSLKWFHEQLRDMKFNLLISCCYTLAYMVVANLLFYNNPLYYFYGGDLSKLLMFPAFISFGAAYTSGDNGALIMTLIVFLVIWALIFLLVFAVRKTYALLRKNNT